MNLKLFILSASVFLLTLTSCVSKKGINIELKKELEEIIISDQLFLELLSSNVSE